jgi:alanyl-tRNA synthetase
LYYDDSYLREFHARVLHRSDDGQTLYLDRTAFYPTSGGQPHDVGSIAGAAVVDVVDEEERIGHRTASPVVAAEVDCRVDWARRFDHMQQHSGQHLLSAVFIEQFGIETCSFHLGDEISTLDLEVPAIEMEKVIAEKRRDNKTILKNHHIILK